MDAGSITSADTQVPHGYYSLPICQATGEEETRTSLFDAGTLVSGRALYNSPYQFRVNVRACHAMSDRQVDASSVSCRYSTTPITAASLICDGLSVY